MPDDLDALLGEPKAGDRWRTLRSILLSLLLALAIFTGVGVLRAPSLPEQAPPFALPDIAGTTVSLKQHRGSLVVLNFWATWCGPCRMEVPAFSAFADDHPEVVVLGLATDDEPSRVPAAVDQLGFTYPVLLADRATRSAYGIDIVPTTVFVDPEGRVAYAHSGLMLGWQLRLLAWWFG